MMKLSTAIMRKRKIKEVRTHPVAFTRTIIGSYTHTDVSTR